MTVPGPLVATLILAVIRVELTEEVAMAGKVPRVSEKSTVKIRKYADGKEQLTPAVTHGPT